MTKDEALRMALEALEQLQGGCTDHDDGTVEAITVWCPEVIDAIKQALAAPVQETPFQIGQRLRQEGKGISDLWGAVGSDADMPEAQRGFDSAAQPATDNNESLESKPTPVQEPVYHLRQFGDVTKEQLDRYMETGDINPQPAPVQPVQEADVFDDDIEVTGPTTIRTRYRLEVGTKLYTTPPAAPVQEPVIAGSLSVRYFRGCKSMTNADFDYEGDLPEGDYTLYTTPPAQPAPVQEPVAWPCLIAEADFSQNTVTLTMQCEDYKVSARQHWLSTTPPAQPAVPDAIHHTDLSESLEYIQGWNECRQAMLEMMK
jgi:hypothetical protein